MSSREEAQKRKQVGNWAYSRNQFDHAINCFNDAIELDPGEITYYTKLASAYLEKKDYPKCVETCDKAIDVGRENRADFKFIANAFARKGMAQEDAGNLLEAKIAYEEALATHPAPHYRTALSRLKSLIKKKEEAFIDPATSTQEKEKGNELFKKGDFATAVKHYSEAIKRNPSDAKIYSNRAACYTKLMSFDLAMADCESSIKMDPAFVKAYLRKAKVLQGMGQQSKVKAVYEKALKLDRNCMEAIEGYKNSILSHADPEVYMNKNEDNILMSPNTRAMMKREAEDRAMECPVCLDVPEEGPIYKCRNGHILCSRCLSDILKTISKCPICFDVFDPSKSLERCFVTELYIAKRPKDNKFLKSNHPEDESGVRESRNKGNLGLNLSDEIQVIDEFVANDSHRLERPDDIGQHQISGNTGVGNIRLDIPYEDDIQEVRLEVGTSEPEAVNLAGMQEDHEYCLRLQQEQEEQERQRIEMEQSDFQYAQRLNLNLNEDLEELQDLEELESDDE